MSINLLLITHSNFSTVMEKVVSELQLPIKLSVIEVDFGRVTEFIDIDKISSFDLLITSGAHWEMIREDFYQLMYTIPIFHLKFTESDIVKALVRAKQYGNRIALMYYGQAEYDLQEYADLLNIKITRLPYRSIQEATGILKKTMHKEVDAIVGTSSICKLAQDLGYPNVMVYSLDSLKNEMIKAYQLATTKSKMFYYGKFMEAMLDHADIPIFLADKEGTISNANPAAVEYGKVKSKQDLIGKSLDQFLPKPYFALDAEVSAEQKHHPIVFEEKSRSSKKLIPLFVNNRVNSYILIINPSKLPKKDIVSPIFLSSKSRYNFQSIIYNSHKMNKLLMRAKQYAQSEAPILIYGETGTGKELLAQSLHQNSKRTKGPFVPVNCAAIPKDILESELFGYEEGAFTGARKGGKAGYFEMAQRGTIFLDEIGEIPLELQTKLLRVLQEKEVIRIGGRELIPLDIRIISATNRSLEKMVAEGKFREDLFYRINILQLRIPPLRERVEDINLLFRHLLKKHGVLDSQVDYLMEIAKTKLHEYPWYGNVRELENFTMRLAALISIHTTNYELNRCFSDVCEDFFQISGSLVQKQANTVPQSPVLSFNQDQTSEIIQALKRNRGNRSLTALELGISRTTLWRRLKEFGINR